MTAVPQSSPSLLSPIGIVAGNGRFPIECAESARSRGLSVAVVALRGEADPVIATLAESITWVGVGQLGKLIRALKRAKCRQVAFAGGVRRVNFVDGFRIDWTGLRMLSKLRSFNDDSIMRGVIREVERAGIEVFAPSVLLEKSVPKPGVYTKRGLTAQDLADARIGWEAARTIGTLDIGQSIVVRNKTIVAVEAVEGTDATLKRVGDVRGEGGVLVKLSKPIQDLRIDLPTIGVGTIESARASRLSAVVVEAGRSIMLDPQAVIDAANRLGIAVVAAEGIEQLVAS
jgi:UDP-2,3-diacylglucosamine hydrolase